MGVIYGTHVLLLTKMMCIVMSSSTVIQPDIVVYTVIPWCNGYSVLHCGVILPCYAKMCNAKIFLGVQGSHFTPHHFVPLELSLSDELALSQQLYSSYLKYCLPIFLICPLLDKSLCNVLNPL